MLPSYDLDAVRTRLASHPLVTDSPEPGRRAAVAAVLRERRVGTSVEILFIRRAEDPRDPWSGHIAFPGGRHDEGDRDLLFTAARETHEEVGVDLITTGSLLTRLPDVPAIARGRRMGLVVAPFVFALSDPDVAIAHNHEVAETLWVPLEVLARGEGAGVFEYPWEGKVLKLPCIRMGPHVLWGLTYQMVQSLLAALHAG